MPHNPLSHLVKHHRTASSSSSGKDGPTSPPTLALRGASISSSATGSTGIPLVQSPTVSSIVSTGSSSAPKSILKSSSDKTTSSSSGTDNRRHSHSSPATSVSGSNHGGRDREREGSINSVDGVCRMVGGSCCYAILALSKNNILQFINILQDSWGPGVTSTGYPKGWSAQEVIDQREKQARTRDEKEYAGEKVEPAQVSEVWEIQMKGVVWGSRGTSSGIAVRQLMTAILQAMYQGGYDVVSSVNASSKDSSKDTIYFKGIDGPRTEIPTEFFSMAFDGDDKIWLIDAPPAVVESVSDHVLAAWTPGIRHSEPLAKHPACYEIRLRGSPWAAMSQAAALNSRMLHLHLLKSIYIKGYKLKASIALADKDEGELDSLFFQSRAD